MRGFGGRNGRENHIIMFSKIILNIATVHTYNIYVIAYIYYRISCVMGVYVCALIFPL